MTVQRVNVEDEFDRILTCRGERSQITLEQLVTSLTGISHLLRCFPNNSGKDLLQQNFHKADNTRL